MVSWRFPKYQITERGFFFFSFDRMSQDVVCLEVGDGEEKKKSPSSATSAHRPPAAQPHSLLPAPACQSLGETARPRSGPVSDASWGSDPEMSTLLPAAPDGNQVSCLMETLSDVLFTLSRDSKAPRPYSRSHAHLKKTIWNITIWCRD